MSRLLQIYFVISFSLFSSVIAKLYTSTHSFFEAYVEIFEKKNYFAVFLNSFFAIGIVFIMFVQTYFMGNFEETEYKQATTELLGFITTLFFVVYHLNIEFVNFNFINLIFCRYLICLINVKVKSFTINIINSNAKSHRKLILLQFLLFLYCFTHFIDNLKHYNDNQFHITLLNHYFLCCNFLFESIINQLIIISDDQNGNTITAYYSRQKISYYGSLISVVINILTGMIILYSNIQNKLVFILLSLYDPVNETFKKIKNYRKWKKFCTDLNKLLSSPTDEELQEHDTCIICRMKLTKEYAKKLPCGHIFHLDCMIVWFGTRQICPICGADIHDLLKQVNNSSLHHAHDHNDDGEINNNELNENQNDNAQYNLADFQNDEDHDHAVKHRRSHKRKSKTHNKSTQNISYSFSDFDNLDEDDDTLLQQNLQDQDQNVTNLIFNQNIQNQSDLSNLIETNNNYHDNNNQGNNAELAEELRQTRELLKEFEKRVRFLESKLQKNDE